MKRMEYLMVSTLGGGPALMALFLMTNYYLHTAEYEINTRIEDIKYKYPYQYFLANGLPCEDYPELCVVHEDDEELKNGKAAVITMARGIGGFEVLWNVKMAKEE